ncbi:MAG: TGS domain-containing protein, partial [Acidobacteria bacterium]|nr:TGS domain-containing protein [Acidobacteriota bacterium]
MLNVTLPDGSVKQVESGATPLQIAESISPRLAKAALVAELDGKLVDLTEPITTDAKLRLLTEKDPEALEVFRHSSAHLLAAATLELYPDTKLGVGPPTDNGFFYDMQREQPFTPEDLEKIEAKMQELVDADLPNRRVWMDRDEALALYREQGDTMKCELI